MLYLAIISSKDMVDTLTDSVFVLKKLSKSNVFEHVVLPPKNCGCKKSFKILFDSLETAKLCDIILLTLFNFIFFNNKL